MPPGDNIHPTSSVDLHTASSSRHRHRDSGVNKSILNNAINTRIENSSFVINNNQAPAVTATSFPDSNIDSLNKLYDRVATNAILNAGGRADEVKCHPGTRVDIISIVERWMDSEGNDSSTPNLLWLSGPAGAGKSAIMQTIAERCKDRGVPAFNFFFFRADPTRSNAQPLVATLLYQIIKVSPLVRQAIATVLSNDPLLFAASIQDQFDQLLSKPLQGTPSLLGYPARRPIVLLIDGLDECDLRHNLSQKQIIQAVDHLVVQENSPFLVLVASRAEPQIAMAFKQLASPVQSIFLDDQYAPEKDIRIFVTGEFNKIKKSHNLAHTLSDSWPSADDTEAIVRKSSGQFIYAATVMRFLSNSSANPVLSLERVRGMAPATKNSPFSQLDAIYAYILSQADDQEAVKDFLAAKLFRNAADSQKDNLYDRDTPLLSITTILSIYDPSRYNLALLDSCASDLTAILQFLGHEMIFYHASFTDFLTDKSRSGDYHIDIPVFAAKVFPAIWMKAPESKTKANSQYYEGTPDYLASFNRVHCCKLSRRLRNLSKHSQTLSS
ncbi:hypothetical protein D9619_003564 [Psilocybe cf. subviscida]|uniref:NACHT domain-containing protein n=1 Tax=Psilocybe cf. subviscida TaxID=2480587 RepID=A0A8H5AWS2_9AGAR|nr:hypothetical protein D9619_003564 [Psilocybe cf. subviscida]